MKKSFKLYGIIFTITAISISAMYVNENKIVLLTAANEVFNQPAAKISRPPEPLLSQFSADKSVHLKAPHLKQLPELPRGCEVTSLAMLLQYSGVSVSKLKLAKQVKKDKTPYKQTNKGVYFGNPNNGFVGDMYSINKPGFGVYHGPIASLAREYIGIERVYDFTGKDFSVIINQLNQNRPVWVIINTSYKKLPKSQFTTWQTKDGPIDITMKEHSVLITGYNQKFIYFNDPLNRSEKAPIEEFEAAWKQMGKQAITVY
ncbi:C39 family peptidase [Virgibacillus sp. JSM 102003]|uniref:C39 family peptidase n=1 Tax=Virgibacillus sp. JSM 102003 TaxID=1562108 RepID=UPI0035BFCF8E